MKLPTANEINPVPNNLDGQYAVQNFLGKSCEQIAIEFSSHGLSYQEDLMFMGTSAFCFYFPAAVRYAASPESRGDRDVVSSLCRVIEFRVEHDGEKIRDAFPAILNFVDQVAANYEKNDLLPNIYGDLRPRLNAIRQKVSVSLSE